jgi:glutamate-1-semialdehyde 2,1-aminomutase
MTTSPGAPSGGQDERLEPRPRAGEAEERIYRSLTPRSARHFAESRRYLPGGDSRSPLFHHPYPVALAEGHGCRLTDIDGNQLLDFTGNHTALPLGYGHPDVIEAVQRQLAAGTCFPGTTRPQLHLARLLCGRIPSLEQVRFTNSGTEATMNAVRAARAFTGRPKIAKIDGGYNGTWDEAMVSTHPPAGFAPDRPDAVAASAGLSPRSTEAVVVLPFNGFEATSRLIEQCRGDLAAVIVEPVLGSAGMIPAQRSYLQMLRELTDKHDILLVFDEVVSFRVSHGAAQEHFRVYPDLTCLGKAVGGGFPLGVFGGRRDVMAAFDPTGPGGPLIPHPGSYNANPISLVAGATTLELLTTQAIGRVNTLGQTLRDRVQQIITDAGIPAQATGLGSLFGIHLTPRPVQTARDAAAADRHLLTALFLALFAQGVLIDPRGVGCLSTALDEEDIDEFLTALDTVIRRWTAHPSTV